MSHIMAHVDKDIFDKEKERVLGKADLSRKGSVDAPIEALVEYINNSLTDYYTSSSCSGRAVVFAEDRGQRKKGCHWLLVSHYSFTLDSLTEACSKSSTIDASNEAMYTYLKFEPFVLHVMCRTFEHAQSMLQVSTESGFRNSGITCGRKGKVMLAVRSTHSLEVPLCYDKELLVTKEYLTHLVKLCDEKFSENGARIQRFFENLKTLSMPKEAKAPKHGKSSTKTTVEKKARDISEDLSETTNDLCFESLFAT